MFWITIVNSNKDDGKQKIVEELTETIKKMRNEIGEFEVNMKLKNSEIVTLKKEMDKIKFENISFTTDADGKPLSMEAKRIKKLEEEKIELKKEIDDIWKGLQEKETLLQQAENENKKLQEHKKQAEKYKQEKGQLNEEIKKISSQVRQLTSDIEDLRSEKDMDVLKYESRIKELEQKLMEKQNTFGNQTMLKDVLEKKPKVLWIKCKKRLIFIRRELMLLKIFKIN